jgi:hypothetical protein
MPVTPRNPNWANHPHGVSTLIAVLVRYPEVSSLNFEPETGLLRVSFCLRTELAAERASEFRARLDETLEAYRELVSASAPQVAEVQVDSMEAVTVLGLVRDVDTLSIEEVGLAIEILRDVAGPELVSDPNDLIEEELIAQEETIEATLESLKETPGGSLLALREEGRILVFNT